MCQVFPCGCPVKFLASPNQFLDESLPEFGHQPSFVASQMIPFLVTISATRPSIINVPTQMQMAADNKMSTINGTPMERMAATYAVHSTRVVCS